MKETHVHKLRRHTYKSGNAIYFCMLPDCSFKINPSLAVGKRTICHRCGEPFIMSDYSIRLAKPHCESCHKPKTLGLVKDELSVDEYIKAPMSIQDDVIESLRSRMSSSKTDDEGEI